MKICVAAVPILVSLAPFLTAETVNAHRFYRPKTHTAKPKQSGVVVVNGASYLPGVSPGGWATIYGQDLFPFTDAFFGSTNPFPTSLNQVSVSVNGVFAPLLYVGPGSGEQQIDFQVPYEASTGAGAADIEILYNGSVVTTLNTDSFTEDPGIFLLQGTNDAIAEDSNYNLITPNNPAIPGDALVLYTTGLGPLDQNIPDGLGAPSDPLATTLDPFQVEVNGEPCQVFFSGLSPGFVGLYQINFYLPSDLPPGNLNIQIFDQYSNSNVAVLPVQ